MTVRLSTHSIKIPYSSYLLLFLFLCFSGNPLFTAQHFSKTILIIYGLILIFFTLFYINRAALFQHIHALLIPVLLVTLLSAFHYFTFYSISVPGIFSLILKIAIGFFILFYFQLISVNPFDVYIRLISFLSFISFPLFILNFQSHYGLQLDAPALKSVLFYTSYPLPPSMLRNSGMFWEPGAFAGYLVLALLFIVMLNGRFSIGKYRYEVLLIVLALFSTFSTTGFLALAFLLLMYLFQNFQGGKYIILPFIIFLFSHFYTQFEFLSDKIEHQFTEAVALESSDVSNTRFGALKMDFQYILDQPFWGNGLDKKIRYRYHPLIEDEIGHGNGMSNFIVWWGIPFFLFWISAAYLFFYRNSQSVFTSLSAVSALLLLLQGEQFLDYPLFLIFFSAYVFKFQQMYIPASSFNS